MPRNAHLDERVRRQERVQSVTHGLLRRLVLAWPPGGEPCVVPREVRLGESPHLGRLELGELGKRHF